MTKLLFVQHLGRKQNKRTVLTLVSKSLKPLKE